MSEKRPYSTRLPEWVHDVLEEYAHQRRMRPAHDVVVTPGGSFPDNVALGGQRNGKETADGREKRKMGPPEYVNLGYFVEGMDGMAKRADSVMRTLELAKPECWAAIRVEYGMSATLDVAEGADDNAKGKALGMYMKGGRPWSGSVYRDLLNQGRWLFMIGYLNRPRG